MDVLHDLNTPGLGISRRANAIDRDRPVEIEEENRQDLARLGLGMDKTSSSYATSSRPRSRNSRMPFASATGVSSNRPTLYPTLPILDRTMAESGQAAEQRRCLMPKVEVSETIDRPIEEVWAYLSDPTALPEWAASTQEVDLLSDGELTEGARVRAVGRSTTGGCSLRFRRPLTG